MMGRTTVLFLLALAATVADANRHHGLAKAHRHGHHHRHSARAPAPAAGAPASTVPAADKACADLCATDEGMDKETCMTECAVSTDTRVNNEAGGTLEEGMEEFVHDKVYNEQVAKEKDGTPEMAETFEKMSGEDAAQFQCLPTVNPEEVTFADVDLNGDGEITKPEAYAFGEKMCEPNERVNDLFGMADVNADGVISKKEFNGRGENQVIEHGVDETLDKLMPGDDEYAECSLPPFSHFDKDHDGFLHEWELAEAFMFEFDRRAGFGVDTITDETRKKLLSNLKDKIMETIPEKFKEADTNGDGKISPEEWDQKTKNTEDMGDQFEEQGEMDEDEDSTDIDDLPSVAAAPAPAFLQRHAVVQDVHHAALMSLCQLWGASIQ